jgi:hypothetical protein
MNSRAASFALAMALLATQPRNAGAQEPVWSFRIGAGMLTSLRTAGDLTPQTRVTLGRTAPTVSIDAIRALDCCLEVWISGTIPWVSVEMSTVGKTVPAGRISPSAIQFGMNYRVWHKNDIDVYVGPFLSGFLPDRSAAVLSADGPIAYHFPGSWGLGGTIGVRKKIDDRLKIDVNVRLQQAHLPTGGSDRILWNPTTITAGLAVRLW